MAFSTLGDWVGKWKQLKNWVLQRSDTVPSDIVEGGFYYDNTSKKPMYYDGTKAKPMGVTNHNDLSLIDGGDPTFRGHTTSVQAGYLNNAGSSNGVALLDSNGYLPIGNIPASLLGAVRYQGTWNPSTNTPTLVTPPSSVTKGYYYVASAVGTWDGKTFAIGDWIISNGTAWERVDNVDAITSVFGRTGAVVATSGDYTAAQVTNTPSGSISATTVQAALDELDSEKLDITTASSTYATKATTAKLTLGTCTTAQATVAKDVVLANYVLTQGDTIEVLFTYASVASATLNVNGTGAKAIYDGGSVASTSSWGAGQLVGLVYDGAYWHILWVKTPNSIGNVIDRTLSTQIIVNDHAANNINYPVVWSNGNVALLKTASKLYFNPSTGLLQAAKVGVIGGAAAEFMKADGTVDSTAYQAQSVTLADNAASSTLPTIAAGTVTSKLQQTRDYLKYLLATKKQDLGSNSNFYGTEYPYLYRRVGIVSATANYASQYARFSFDAEFYGTQFASGVIFQVQLYKMDSVLTANVSAVGTAKNISFFYRIVGSNDIEIWAARSAGNAWGNAWVEVLAGNCSMYLDLAAPVASLPSGCVEVPLLNANAATSVITANATLPSNAPIGKCCILESNVPFPNKVYIPSGEVLNPVGSSYDYSGSYDTAYSGSWFTKVTATKWRMRE